jgi:hypothetical protein
VRVALLGVAAAPCTGDEGPVIATAAAAADAAAAAAAIVAVGDTASAVALLLLLPSLTAAEPAAGKLL